ncbi:MAG: hypothetical protein A2W09_01365 [Deltaproteobacteria bacterium RBG_16_50_11]|nr:MAG: hypothetical protein A2W09_01365 [Deltaproteobacteria bacterium RBG_16_50_11]
MRKTILIILFSLLFLLPGTLLAKGLDFYSMFPNLTLGFDPSGVDTDTARAVNGGLSATQQKVQIRVITDNANPDDYLQGVQVDVAISADCQGVTLDETEATVFGGSAAGDWGIKSVAWVAPSTGIPGTLRVGAVELDTLDPGAPLGPGNHLFATLVFNLSEPCNICCEIEPYDEGDPTIFVTTLANGYGPVVEGDCFGPAVPTLSEWGLILFGLVLLVGIVWYVRRRRIAVAA